VTLTPDTGMSVRLFLPPDIPSCAVIPDGTLVRPTDRDHCNDIERGEEPPQRASGGKYRTVIPRHDQESAL